MKKKYMISGFLAICLLVGANLAGAEETWTLDPVTVKAQQAVSAEKNTEQLDVNEESGQVISTVPDVIRITSYNVCYTKLLRKTGIIN